MSCVFIITFLLVLTKVDFGKKSMERNMCLKYEDYCENTFSSYVSETTPFRNDRIVAIYICIFAFIYVISFSYVFAKYIRK